jgi:hypothetical protein
VMGAEGLLWSHGSSWWWWPTKMAFIQMTPNMAKVRWKRQRHTRKVSNISL